ncbi:MAG: methyltransferase domain-containing protein [Parvularculaceae bacterium]
MDNGGAFTDRLLNSIAGTTGLNALDVGCGPGDVTLRLARLVGPNGHAVGVDLNEKLLGTARERAAADGFENVTFRQGDVCDLPTDVESFDVASCRRVLMYLPDKVRAVRCMLRALRPGGVLVLQEHDASLTASSAPLPLNNQANRMIWNTVAGEGADTALGLKLHRILSEAGATDIQVIAEAVVQTPSQAASTGTIIKLMADRIVASGVATQQELDTLDPSTLDDRLAAERRETGASFVGEMIFGVIARKSGD